MSKQKDSLSLRRTHYAQELKNAPLGSEVTAAGWVEDARPLGSLLFFTIRDVTGVCQTIFSKKTGSPELFDSASRVPRQSFVAVRGLLKESKAHGIPVEIEARELKVVSEAVHPLPIDPTGRVQSSLDARLDSRALDLRDPAVKAVFLIRHTALQAIRRSLGESRFIEINTPKIIGQAAEGGANLFGLDYFGRKAFLAQSPQLYKEQFTLSLDRVFEISTYYRAEKSHTRRHLNEFVSVDIEAALMDEEDAMRICEDLVVETAQKVVITNPHELDILRHRVDIPKKPFERLTYRSVIAELSSEGVPIEHGEDLTDHALRILGEKHAGYYFITDWPTELKPFYIARKQEEPGLTRGFDFQFGSVELASGGMRVTTGGELRQRLMEAGLDPNDFADHLKSFEWGMPPHSGWGLGLDRLVMVLTGRDNIREVVLHPRDRFRLTP